jgi:predicted RNA-binding Zn-ribbon protein involved in translation (DUF1610 family)
METTKKKVRIPLVCQECGKKWTVSPNAADPECPKCGGVDFEVSA